MRKKYTLSLFFLGSFIFSGANSASGDSCVLNKSPKNSPWFLFTAGYRMPVNKNVILNSGHGFYFEGGINPGKFISKKLVIGLYAGWAWKDGLWSTAFNSDWVKDYSSSIHIMSKETGFSNLDSSVISTTADLISTKKGRSPTMPGCEMRSFHNYSLYYGLVIKLPCRYAPALKVYTGSTRSHYQGGGHLVTGKTGYNIFQFRRAMYGCELIIFKGLQKTCRMNIAALSFYYEYCNFSKASLYFDNGEQTRNIPLKQYTSSFFLQKYRSETSWGFKLSCTIL